MFDLKKHDKLAARQREAARASELIASLDESGSVVLHTRDGEIKLYVADGKMQVKRRGSECADCVRANLKFAKALAKAWNIEQVKRARVTVIGNSRVERPVCGRGNDGGEHG